MLTIRFQRTGKRNRAEFRLVVAPKTAAAQKKFTEILGSYNPRTKSLVVKDQARMSYWLSQKLEMSPSAQNLLVSQKMVPGPKARAFNIPKKPVAAEVPPALEAVPKETQESGASEPVAPVEASA